MKRYVLIRIFFLSIYFEFDKKLTFPNVHIMYGTHKFFNLISLILPILYIPVIFYLFQKETMIMQLLNDIVIF